MNKWLLWVIPLVLLASSRAAWAQAPAPPPELSVLKRLEGVWDASIKAGEESKGVMTCKFGLGGLWLITDFEGDLGGQKFVGKGLDTFDPAEKKFVAVWADSMSLSPLIMKGEFDEAQQTMTSVGEGRDPNGNVMKFKGVTKFKDKDTHDWTLFMILPDGMEVPMVAISYKRRQ